MSRAAGICRRGAVLLIISLAAGSTSHPARADDLDVPPEPVAIGRCLPM
jgi:predicted anti-sigma-YlaC factor YlaD